jgi:predicted Rossmann fold flavoprotein
MSAIEAGKRGRSVLLVDHSKKIGEKIRISGGGRCNFTNLYTNPSKFISQNPNFMISALNQYTQYDFIELIKKYQIKFHEKKLGQLFCDESAQQIIDMLLLECKKSEVTLKKETHVLDISKKDNSYITNIGSEEIFSNSLIIATGGLSIPKMGATKFGYDIAKKFDMKVVETEPALVPLTFSDKFLLKCKNLQDYLWTLLSL